MGEARNILIGAATVLYTAWTSSQTDVADGSMTDAGYTSGPTEWGGSVEQYDVKVEQSFFPVLTKLTDMKMTVKVPWVEMTLAALAKMFNQSYTSGDLTIAQPDESLYYQVVLKGSAPSTSANIIRRVRLYKCKFIPPTTINIAKAQETRADVQIVPLYDNTRTVPALAKITDAAT